MSSNNKYLIPNSTDYTNINGWKVSIKLPKELSCHLLEHLKYILKNQEDAFYKLELYLAYKITDEINYALLCTRKTTNPIEEKLCIVTVSGTAIINLIAIEAKRIIRCEDECTSDPFSCYKDRSKKFELPKYYYLTNRKIWAVYSCEKAIPIKISMSALRLLYKTIKSYFVPIQDTNDSLHENNQINLRAYPTAVNDNITDYQLTPTSG